MTIEEKARAYDEAVNKLRRFMAQGVEPLITRADVQDFFPELKESEDERIKKNLIGYINGISEYEVCEETKDSWIAWLEKQGEEDSSIQQAYKQGYIEGQRIERKCWLEKQGQEKHLSEPIKDYQGSFTCWNNAHDFRPKHLQRCICYDKYMGGVYCYVYDDISKYWCTQTTEEHDSDGDNHICDYADYRITLWMPLPDTSFYPSKSRFDKQREQKSTWSDEDERNLKCIMKIIKEKAFADYDIDEDNNMLGIYGILENWMKSLKQRIG